MNKKVQISESIELGILLALSGGFMDAYSYIGRGEVFALFLLLPLESHLQTLSEIQE